ncbi:MAG: gephyrin-like molybdotransferase Glp [Rhodococcus erythropolis]
MNAPSFRGRDVDDHRRAVVTLLASVPRTSEDIPLVDLIGSAYRTLASDVVAPADLPTFDNSQMDGFAIRSADLAADGQTTLAITGHVAAGTDAGVLAAGEACAVMTGAPLPVGADAVVPIEQSGVGSFPGPGDRAVMRVSGIAAGQFVRPAGSDVRRGEVIAPAGSPVTAPLVGALAATGIDDVELLHPLRVLVVATGSEVRSASEADRSASVLDANTPALLALVRGCGAVGTACKIVADDPDQLLRALDAATESVDLVVTTGGVSMGAHEVVREALGPRGLDVGTVAMQPGGPQGLGVVRLSDRVVPVIAFPGNPVSALVSAEMFLRPALLEVNGWAAERARVSGPLVGSTDSPSGKLQLRRGRLRPDGAIEFVGGPSSHLLTSFGRANLLVRIPADRVRVDEGHIVDAWRIDA